MEAVFSDVLMGKKNYLDQNDLGQANFLKTTSQVSILRTWSSGSYALLNILCNRKRLCITVFLKLMTNNILLYIIWLCFYFDLLMNKCYFSCALSLFYVKCSEDNYMLLTVVCSICYEDLQIFIVELHVTYSGV